MRSEATHAKLTAPARYAQVTGTRSSSKLLLSREALADRAFALQLYISYTSNPRPVVRSVLP